MSICIGVLVSVCVLVYECVSLMSHKLIISSDVLLVTLNFLKKGAKVRLLRIAVSNERDKAIILRNSTKKLDQ